MRYAVIDSASSSVIRTGICSAESLELQADAGQIIVLDPPDFTAEVESYWDGTSIVPCPPRPTPYAVWTGSEWIDPRNPEDAAAEALARLEAARAAASMSRADLLLAAVGAGLIPASEAGAAARGEVPPSMQALFESLPPETQIEAVIRWGASTVIDRTNPILLALAEGLGATDADLDALFGIAPTT